MKKFISSLLILSMIFTGVATTVCFADEEVYQENYEFAGETVPLNFNIEINANGGDARAEAKAEANASGGSKISKIAKIVLLIALIITVKKCGKVAVDTIQPVLEDIKSQLKNLPKNVAEKVESLKVKASYKDDTEEKSTINAGNIDNKSFFESAKLKLSLIPSIFAEIFKTGENDAETDFKLQSQIPVYSGPIA